MQVNGKVETNLSTRIDPDKDIVLLDGKEVSVREQKVTLAVNKPEQVMVTRKDTHQRTTIYDVLDIEDQALLSKLIYVGRLDFETTGLLIMTTDGDLAHKLTHPSSEVIKQYFVLLDRHLSEDELVQLQQGLLVDGKMTSPCTVEYSTPKLGLPEYFVYIHEGRKRQVRRMFSEVDADVLRLERLAIGKLRLEDLKLSRGESVQLSDDQVRMLYK